MDLWYLIFLFLILVFYNNTRNILLLAEDSNNGEWICILQVMNLDLTLIENWPKF